MNDLDLCLEVVSKSRQPLRYIWRWISRKPLEIEAWFQRTTNRNGIWTTDWSRDRWRHVTLKGQTRDPNTLRAQYLENYFSYRDFKFGMQLCIGNAERAHNNFPWKWMWPKSRDAYIFWHTIEHISKTIWATDFKFGKRHLTYHCYLAVGFCILWSTVRQYGRLS